MCIAVKPAQHIFDIHFIASSAVIQEVLEECRELYLEGLNSKVLELA